MNRLWICGWALAVAGVSLGCASKSGSGAWIGAGSGAAVGAGVGAAVGGGKGALIGGAIGAAAGAGSGALIGNYMDRQERKLRQSLRQATIERQGDQLLVKFKSGILFDSGKSYLRQASQESLNDFAAVLTEYPDTDLFISGHTDNTGGKALNQKLSLARAQSVEEFLAQKGVAGGRMSSSGYADERPLAGNDSEAGREQNRRVEIQISANEKLRRQATGR